MACLRQEQNNSNSRSSFIYLQSQLPNQGNTQGNVKFQNTNLGQQIAKGYLRYKTILCHEVALAV